jgi:hypothetical protein
MADMLIVRKSTALEWGMTHHGSLFGAPAWVTETEYGVDAVPKFLPMGAWCWLCDKLYDLATYFLPPGTWIEAPLKIGRPIL